MRRFEVADNSMSPSFEPGDYLFTGRLRRPLAGAVVVFEHPHRSGFHLIKRIAAVPGDHVRVDGSVLEISGGQARRIEIPPQPAADWQVPDGQVFVLSDAVEATRADSRQFGPIPTSGCHLVTFRYWPLKRIAVLSARRVEPDR